MKSDKLPVGATYYAVSEEQWFTGESEDDVNRDFHTFANETTLDDAKAAVLGIDHDECRGRIYIDRMEKTEGGAWGLPVWVGRPEDMRAGTGWRPENMAVPNKPVVSNNAAKGEKKIA